MTFPEAGIQILEKAGHPMHFQEIAHKAIQEGLLSHVGQIPEQTMRERLIALARRSSDRKLVVVGPGQFALTDWGLPEDAKALAELETLAEPPDEKPLRSKERHPPVQKAQTVRTDGRERERDRKKKRRLPPLSVVVAEILGEVGATADLDTLLAKGRERGQMSDDLPRETLLSALNEENRRRTKSSGGPVFEINQLEVTLLSADALAPARGEEEVREIEPESAERPSAIAQLTLESRKQTARQLRRRIQELSTASIERLGLQLLAKSGYRDARPVNLGAAERERLYLARRRLGLTELRFLIQMLPLGREATKESVQAMRSYLIEAEAHAGVILGPGEATREARTESQRLGLPLLSLLCSDAFVEELVLREIGVVTYQATVVDDAFWRTFRKGPEKGRSSRSRESSPPVHTPVPSKSESGQEAEAEPDTQPQAVEAVQAAPTQIAVEPAPAPIQLVNPITPSPSSGEVSRTE